MQHEQAIHIIEKVLTQLRPMIQSDGGDIQLIKYEDNVAYVRLLGACVQCPISQITLKLGVEDALKQEIPELKEVVAIE